MHVWIYFGCFDLISSLINTLFLFISCGADFLVSIAASIVLLSCVVIAFYCTIDSTTRASSRELSITMLINLLKSLSNYNYFISFELTMQWGFILRGNLDSYGSAQYSFQFWNPSKMLELPKHTVYCLWFKNWSLSLV